MDTRVSIGKVKRDISELVNRAAFGKERIILTSRGKPKAVIVPMDDYERLKQLEVKTELSQWQVWLQRNEALSKAIGSVDVEKLWTAAREELEARNDHLFGN